ncbi:MAG: STT3 domain-containing protein [Candidatus Hydrothermarchaeales archaeon]
MNLEGIGEAIDLDKLKRHRIWALLIAIFLIGFSVRYLPHGPRLAALDPWFNYIQTKYILELGYLPKIYPLAYYPEGRNVWAADAVIMFYFIAYTFKLAQPFGISLMEYMIAFPAVMGGLACVALYFVAKELFNERIGLFSALIYTFIPAATSRVWAGFADKESMSGLMMFLWVFFLLKSYKSDLSERKNLIWPILSGAFFAFAIASWSGGNYIALVIFFSALVYLIFKKDMNLIKAIAVMTPIGLLLLWVIQPLRFPLTKTIFTASYSGLVIITIIYLISIFQNAIDERFENIPALYTYSAFVGLFLISIIVLGVKDQVLNMMRGMINIVSQSWRFIEVTQQDIYMATVAESQPTYFWGSGNTIFQRLKNGDWFGYLNATLLVFPIGIFFIARRFFKNKDYASAFAFVWITSGIVAMRGGQRLNFFMGPSAAVFTGYVLLHILSTLRRKEKELKIRLSAAKKEKVRYRLESQIGNVKIGHYLVLFVVLMVTFSTLDVGVAAMSTRKSDVPAPWYNAMIWIKENTPENSVMFAWWDYGYWFQAVAERYSIADGGGNVPRNKDLAKMFTSPEEEAMQYIEKYVDYRKVPTYMLVSFEEFGKSSAINHIAQDALYFLPNTIESSGDRQKDEEQITAFLSRNNITSYYIVNYGDYYQIWITGYEPTSTGFVHRPEMKDKLLAKLMPFNTGWGQGLKHFKLVYVDNFRYIFIYRIV